MRINFVLIDSENVKPEYIEKLKHEHFRVVVFVGANLKRLDFPTVHAVQTLGSNGSYVRVTSHGPNALDFYIAYYIGKLAAAHPDAYFHIISKDKGFDPLIKTRPATITSLQSAIHSHFNRVLSGEEVAEVLKALTTGGQVVVNGKKVAYTNLG